MDAIKILRHLAHGWQGFVGILADATAAGVQLPPEEIERLKRMQDELQLVLERQAAIGQNLGATDHV